MHFYQVSWNSNINMFRWRMILIYFIILKVVCKKLLLTKSKNCCFKNLLIKIQILNFGTIYRYWIARYIFSSNREHGHLKKPLEVRYCVNTFLSEYVLVFKLLANSHLIFIFTLRDILSRQRNLIDFEN